MKFNTKIFLTTILLCSSCFFASAEDKKIEPKKFNLPYKTYPLQGKLTKNLVFNSNSPEIVKTEGILLSTFSSEGKENKNAHLEQEFEGEFDIFTHHIAVERKKGDLTTLYQGILLGNPTNKLIRVKILASASYLSQPDAPFVKLDNFIENNDGRFFAGPGDRVSQDILREKNFLEKEIRLQPNEIILLKELPIPIKTLLAPYINGRTTLIKLKSSGPVNIADLALYEKEMFFFSTKPTLQDWINILNKGNLSEQRDKIPSPLDKPLEKGKPFIYGRVSGVAEGNKWIGKIVNDNDKLLIPEKGNGFSFVLNTVYNNTFGTNQVQSGEMKKRYDDTAYQSHSNYGVTYEVEIPLYNNTNENKTVSLSFDSPIRLPEKKEQKELSFFEEPPERICFRGEIKLEFDNNEKYIHLVQRFGQKGISLQDFVLKPNEVKNVKVSYVYPADATPPHVLTVSTKN
ncbi:MAG: DUF3370 domain-containing protein [Candidatus Sericytochromatia bacterium]